MAQQKTLSGPPEKILICGGGVFGISLAWHLAKEGGLYHDQAGLVTLLDRTENPPARDAASSDINRIIRQDYSDPLYARLAKHAIKTWTAQEGLKNYYHQSGLLITARSNARAAFERLCITQVENPSPLGPPRILDSRSSAAQIFSKDVPTGEGIYPGLAYHNPAAGWADAAGATQWMARECKKLGVNIVGKEAKELIFRDGDVIGAKLIDGTVLEADFTILSAGGWSAKLLPELYRSGKLRPTGQVTAIVSLADSKEKWDAYGKGPVVLSWDDGFYIFPPNEDGLLKFAIHGPGFIHGPSDGGSKELVPRTKMSGGGSEERDNIPREALKDLRKRAGMVYPEVGGGHDDQEKEFKGMTIHSSRNCWYMDTPDTEWFIDYHDKYPSLFLATGGSGHAFKFVPVLGDLIISGMRRKLPPEYQERFSFKRERTFKPDPSRHEPPTVVDDWDQVMATREDFSVPA